MLKPLLMSYQTFKRPVGLEPYAITDENNPTVERNTEVYV